MVLMSLAQPVDVALKDGKPSEPKTTTVLVFVSMIDDMQYLGAPAQSLGVYGILGA